MNPDTTFERELQGWLAADAPASAPVGLHDMVIERARTSRQRPSWLVFLRGGAFPSPAATIGRPAARLTYLLVVLGLVLALIAIAIAAGALRSRPVRLPGTWAATAPMNVARIGHRATLLLNGKVLVTGGYTVAGSLASAELYDPGTGTWTVTGSMIEARSALTATLLLNGKVLVAGGYNGTSIVASAELYDPGTGTWTVTGSMIEARSAQTATLLSDGKVLVAGGAHDSGNMTLSVASAELYDPASGSWTATGNMADALNGHTATLLPDGQVLIAGGASSDAVSTRTVVAAELYDAANGTWTATGNMLEPAELHRATLLLNGKVLVAGGDPVAGSLASELYDPASGTWTATGNMVTPGLLVGFTAMRLLDGRVLVAGGQGGNDIVASAAELYDPASGTWTTAGGMITPRAFHTATLLRDGTVLLAGGSGRNYSFVSSAELYDPGKP